MASLVVRGLDDVAKEKLRERANRHGRSLEAEVRAILEAASQADSTAPQTTKPEELGFGTLMHERFGKRGLTPRELRCLERAAEEMRDSSVMRIPDFDE